MNRSRVRWSPAVSIPFGANERVTCARIRWLVTAEYAKLNYVRMARWIIVPLWNIEENFLKVITMLYRVSVFLIFFFFFYTIY